ncbi:MAG TPA: hypothetical protein PKA49_13830 [Tepidiformaceae bacterium]|jgi:hypothetical protein|nr:hypothetical protein [Thermoflexaceae bacterium]HMS59919.1 hypothetical protein [Tepidiformaceae bacterium]
MSVTAIGPVHAIDPGGAFEGVQVGVRASPDRVVLSADAYRAAQDGAGGDESGQLPFTAQGGRAGWVTMTPGNVPGMMHVSVRLSAGPGASDGPGADGDPVVSLEADVRSTWLQNVSRGASTQNEQATRIAEALANVAALPGQGTVRAGGQSGVIRGPVRPAWPQVWLPAEYPPPPDDPSLIAEVRAQDPAA